MNEKRPQILQISQMISKIKICVICEICGFIFFAKTLKFRYNKITNAIYHKLIQELFIWRLIREKNLIIILGADSMSAHAHQ